jgi:hypothetical protein
VRPVVGGLTLFRVSSLKRIRFFSDPGIMALLRPGLAIAIVTLLPGAAMARPCKENEPMREVTSLEVELPEDLDVSKCGDPVVLTFVDAKMHLCGGAFWSTMTDRSVEIRFRKPAGGHLVKQACRLKNETAKHPIAPLLEAKAARFTALESENCSTELHLDFESALLNPVASAVSYTIDSLKYNLGSGVHVTATCRDEKGKDVDFRDSYLKQLDQQTGEGAPPLAVEAPATGETQAAGVAPAAAAAADRAPASEPSN